VNRIADSLREPEHIQNNYPTLTSSNSTVVLSGVNWLLIVAFKLRFCQVDLAATEVKEKLHVSTSGDADGEPEELVRSHAHTPQLVMTSLVLFLFK